MKTLDEFLKRENKFPNNAYVKEPGFKDLYVRDCYHMVEGAIVPTLDIANVTATKPGNGAFTKLIKRLHTDHNLYVECVTSPRFEALLLRLGFKMVDSDHALSQGFPSYYLPKRG